MVMAPAVNPIASRGYLTLVLDVAYTGLAKVLSVVAQMEGAMTEAEILSACAEESVRRIQDPFKPAVQLRRQHFLTTSFLADQPSANAPAAATAGSGGSAAWCDQA